MTRRDLRDLALLRLQEAEILVKNRCWEGAYYLAGYAVECALKACIAKSTDRFEFPDKKRVDASYTHKLAQLLNVAGLDQLLEQAMQQQPWLASNWNVVRAWSEEARYQRHSESEAKELFRAVSEKRDGILSWLKKRW